jgi:hypothetical protein
MRLCCNYRILTPEVTNALEQQMWKTLQLSDYESELSYLPIGERGIKNIFGNLIED